MTFQFSLNCDECGDIVDEQETLYCEDCYNSLNGDLKILQSEIDDLKVQLES